MSAVNPFAHSATTSSLLASDMVRNLDTLIRVLKRARVKRGFSEKSLAAEIGYDEDDVLEFEHHELSPSIEFLVAYGIAVKVHIQFQTTDGETWAGKKRNAQGIIERSISEWSNQSETEPSASMMDRRELRQIAYVDA